MNHLERSISDTGFTKLSSIGGVVAAPFKGVANMYSNANNDGKSYMGLGGGGFVLGTMAAPYAGQAITNITGHKSRMGGMLATPKNLGSIPVPFSGGKRIPIGQIKTRSTLRGRALGGARLAGALMGTKLLADYAGGLNRGSLTKSDLSTTAGLSFLGANVGAGLASAAAKKTRAPLRYRFKPAFKGALKGGLLAAVPSVLYHYSQNKV